MASDVDSKQNEATCSNKNLNLSTNLYPAVFENISVWHIFSGIRLTMLQKLTKINY